MSEQPTGLSQIATVFVPVTDQDAAIAFYVGRLDWEQRVDFVYGGEHRWVEVAPRGSTFAIALVPPSEGAARPRAAAVCAIVSTDIVGDHAALVASGVDVDASIAGQGSSRDGLIETSVSVDDPVPDQFFFRDPDGNRFLVVPASPG